MNHRVLIFLVIANFCSGMDMPPQQDIILLNGTTTAGKTTTALRLKDLLEKKSLPVEVLAIDKFVVSKVQWMLLTNSVNVFRSDWINKEEMDQIKKTSQLELCAAVKTAYQEGKTVIIDVPVYESDQITFYQQEFAGFPVTKALVYCPLSTLIDRVVDRNEKSGIADQRSILQALDQFAQMYNSQTMQPIDQLSQKDLGEICDKAYDKHKIMQGNISSLLKSVQDVICSSNIYTISRLAVRNLSPNPNVKTQIGPVMEHDCIVNTEKNSPAQCAEAIMTFLLGKN